jgi:hypothetical protein
MLIKLTKTDGSILGIESTEIKKVEGLPTGPSLVTMKCSSVYRPNGELIEDTVYEVVETPDAVIKASTPLSANFWRTSLGGI